jgi:hypothetical protein
LQGSLAAAPPPSAGLGLVHAVDPNIGESGVAFVHTPASMGALQAVNVLCPCKLQLHASAAHNAYVLPFSLSTDLAGAYAMKSRRNLARVSQG